jgi:hypothetical protein
MTSRLLSEAKMKNPLNSADRGSSLAGGNRRGGIPVPKKVRCVAAAGRREFRRGRNGKRKRRREARSGRRGSSEEAAKGVTDRTHALLTPAVAPEANGKRRSATLAKSYIVSVCLDGAKRSRQDPRFVLRPFQNPYGSCFRGGFPTSIRRDAKGAEAGSRWERGAWEWGKGAQVPRGGMLLGWGLYAEAGRGPARGAVRS